MNINIMPNDEFPREHEAPADLECRKVAFLAGPTSDQRGPTIQVCRQWTWLILVDLDSRREEFRKLNAPHLVEKVAEGHYISTLFDNSSLQPGR